MPLFILGLLPAIPHILVGIEHMLGHGTGPAKKSAATSMIGDLVNIFSSQQQSGSGSPGADSSTMAFIDDLIEATVKYFNTNGTFTHGAK